MRVHNLLLASLFVAGSQVQPAFAYSSFMARFEVKSQTEQGCMNAVGDIVRNKRLKVAWNTAHTVEGTRGNSVVTITCVGRGGGAAALCIVFVADETGEKAKAVGEEFRQAIAGVVTFD
jgi:hypothetical protein